MHLVLEIRSGSLLGQRTKVEPGHALRVGRTSRADLVILDDTHMSSVHFVVECDAKGCVLRDLNSRNKTFLNGEEVGAAALKHGDMILAGETTFLVQIVDENGVYVAPMSGEVSTRTMVVRAIFVSYRRDDAEGEAGRLFDDLVSRFGEDSVFMDVAAIEAGRDFRKVIDDSVSTCGVLLAIIGKNWLDAKDDTGQRRLDSPNDFVRLETASALKRDIPVIPVLVHGARMPRADQLPDDLKELTYRNGVELTHARWNSDLQVLISALQRHVSALQRHVKDRKSETGSPSQTETRTLAESKPPVPDERDVPVQQVASAIPVPVAESVRALPTKVYAAPPGLHWGILLAIDVLTCGIFGWAWVIVQAVWVRKVQPASKALLPVIVAVVCFAIAVILESNNETKEVGAVFSLAGAVLWFIGVFSMKSSIEEHYNSVEPIGLQLSAVMTFFFSVIYFQYHFTEIARRKQSPPLSTTQRP